MVFPVVVSGPFETNPILGIRKSRTTEFRQFFIENFEGTAAHNEFLGIVNTLVGKMSNSINSPKQRYVTFRKAQEIFEQEPMPIPKVKLVNLF